MEKGQGKGTDTLPTDNVFTRKEYIEREAVLALAKDICVLTKWDSEYHHRSIDPCDVRELPAADVVPIRHGKWVGHDIGGRISIDNDACSECGSVFYQIAETGCVWYYCPNCGARMDGDGDV